MKHPLNPVRPTPRSPQKIMSRGHSYASETLASRACRNTSGIADCARWRSAGVLLSPSHASFRCRFLPPILIPASALRSVAKVLGRRPPWWYPPRGRAAAPRARHLQHDLLGPWFPRTRPAECARSAAARGQPALRRSLAIASGRWSSFSTNAPAPASSAPISSVGVVRKIPRCGETPVPGDFDAGIPARADESSVASGLAGVLMSILRNQVSGSTRACQLLGVSEAAAREYLSALARNLSTYSVPTFRAAVSSWKPWSLWSASSSTSGAVLKAPAVSVQAFLESVPMGGSSFQKNAACPRAAMRVLAGLTLLLC